MKRIPIIMLLLIVLGTPSRVCTQGLFRLTNVWRPAGVFAPVYDWQGNLLSGPQWRVELYGGATSSSLSPVVDYVYGSREIISFDSPFTGPGFFVSNNGDLAVLGIPNGGWAWLQVKVWDVTLGTTYEEAVARGLGGYGESPIFYAQGSPVADTPYVPAPLIGLQSFSLRAVVPEPATWALLALGGLGVWWATRRSQGG